MNNETVTIDVRDDIRHGREPFSKIMKAIRELAPGQQVLLIAPFRPVPLFGVLNKKGFVHHAHQIETGDWEVVFMRATAKSEGNDCSSHESGRADFPIPEQAPRRRLNSQPPTAALRHRANEFFKCVE